MLVLGLLVWAWTVSVVISTPRRWRMRASRTEVDELVSHGDAAGVEKPSAGARCVVAGGWGGRHVSRRRFRFRVTFSQRCWCPCIGTP